MADLISAREAAARSRRLAAALINVAAEAIKAERAHAARAAELHAVTVLTMRAAANQLGVTKTAQMLNFQPTVVERLLADPANDTKVQT